MAESISIPSLAELNLYNPKAFGGEGFIAPSSGETLNTYPISGNEETGESNPYISGAGFHMAGIFTDLITQGSVIKDSSKQGEENYSANVGLTIPIGKTGFSAELQGVGYAGSWSQGGYSGNYSGMSSSYGASYANYDKKGNGYNANVSVSPRGARLGVQGQYRF